MRKPNLGIWGIRARNRAVKVCRETRGRRCEKKNKTRREPHHSDLKEKKVAMRKGLEQVIVCRESRREKERDQQCQVMDSQRGGAYIQTTNGAEEGGEGALRKSDKKNFETWGWSLREKQALVQKKARQKRRQKRIGDRGNPHAARVWNHQESLNDQLASKKRHGGCGRWLMRRKASR